MIEEGELSAEALIAELRQCGVTTVVLGGADTHGIMRGKRVAVEQLERLVEHGLPIYDVFWVLNVDESEMVPARPTTPATSPPRPTATRTSLRSRTSQLCARCRGMTPRR